MRAAAELRIEHEIGAHAASKRAASVSRSHVVRQVTTTSLRLHGHMGKPPGSGPPSRAAWRLGYLGSWGLGVLLVRLQAVLGWPGLAWPDSDEPGAQQDGDRQDEDELLALVRLQRLERIAQHGPP